MENNLKEKRKKAKLFKTLGAVFFTIEFISLVAYIIYSFINFTVINKNNYYSMIKKTDDVLTVTTSDEESYKVYNMNDKIYATESHWDYRNTSDIGVSTYKLDSYDDNYYYLKNDDEVIKIEYRRWIAELIDLYEKEESSQTSTIDIYASIRNTNLKEAPAASYEFYDAGDTLGARVIYLYKSLYEAKSHNRSGITFEYIGTYSSRGDDLVVEEDESLSGATLKLNSSDLISSYNSYKRQISETDAWLLVIFGPIWLLFTIVIYLLVCLIIPLTILSFYLMVTARSYRTITSNNLLKVLGVLLFVFGCGIFSFIGAHMDEECVEEIVAEQNRQKEEKIKREETKKFENGQNPNKSVKFIATPTGGYVISALGGAFISISIYDKIVYYIFDIKIINKLPIFNSFFYDGFQIAVIGIILLIVGFRTTSDYVKKRNKYNELKAQDEAMAKENNDNLFDDNHEKPIKPRFCKYCGSKINSNDLFCSNCGAKIDYINHFQNENNELDNIEEESISDDYEEKDSEDDFKIE